MGIRLAIIAVNYGPYHLARARALSEITGLDPVFIELNASVNSHPWKCETQKAAFGLRTLSNRPFEECSYQELSRDLRCALEEINPEVVITTSFRPFVMLSAARWARWRHKRTVFFYETTPWDKRRHRTTELLKRLTIARYYDAAFVGGKAHRDYLLRLGMPASLIWEPYDVVDNDYFTEAANRVRANSARWRQQLDLPANYFLYVGRLSAEKNLLRLLQSYKLYRQRRRDGWPLVIVGEGPQRHELEQAVIGSQYDGVRISRFQQVEMLPAFYALAGCFILPSIVDPWGLVVNEAMACGLPVLVSRLCGSGFDLVDEGLNGFCFDPYDLECLAGLLDLISSLSDGKREEMSYQSRRIISRFTPKIWAERLADGISFLIGGERAQAVCYGVNASESQLS